MDKIKNLLLENKAWSMGKMLRDPEYFKKLAKDQKPDFFWIGCSDSRVDPRELTNTQPGEMFVHRNIANLVIDTDENLMSAIQYAVEALKVNHVIICGHQNCGGVKGSMEKVPYIRVESWIKPIRDVMEDNREDLDRIADVDERCNRLVELNVLRQFENLAVNPSIRAEKARRNGYPLIHAWVFEFGTGQFRAVTDPR